MSVERHLAPFLEALEGPSNRWVRQWKAEGRPVIGAFCSYVPPEVATAAGALPYRLRGTGSVDSASADLFLSHRTCTFVRHTVALALEGELDFLDGEVSCNCCDHVRRAYDVLRHKTAVRFHGFVSVPRNVRESLYGYYREEVERLRDSLARHLGVAIGDEALARAAAAHDRIRERVARLNELAAAEEPALTGAGLLAVEVAATAMPPEAFVELADRLVEALEGARGARPRARLVLAGGELDDPGYVAAIERQGAAVVGDALCFGGRPARSLVGDPGPDPLDAICRRAFFQTPCARMIGNFPDRVASLLDLVRERRADGVVLQRLVFCDPWGGEAHNLRLRLREQGVPLLVLEREYGLRHAGQVGTRVQAFLELIEATRASRPERAAGGEAAR